LAGIGDLELVLLRRGNRGSAKYWRRLLLPVIERYRGLDIPKFFRNDATFAGPKLSRLLEREGFRYATRDRTRPSREMHCKRLPAVVVSSRPIAIAPERWNGRQPSGPGR
jgi:hypothetical protein